MPGRSRSWWAAPTAPSACWSPGSPPLSPRAAAAIGELADAYALERSREGAHRDRVALRGDLIEELMAGEAVSRESLVRRARHLGADLSRGAVALIGKLQDPHTEGRVITDLTRRFLQQARARWTCTGPGAGRLERGPPAALLPPAVGAPDEPPREEVEAQAFTLGKRLLGATRETVPGLVLTLALALHARAGAPRVGPRRVAAGPGDRRAARPRGRGRDLRGDRDLQAPLPDLRRPARGAELVLRPDHRAARALRRAVPDRAGRDPLDLPRPRLQPRRHREHPLHAPPHGALPPRPDRRAVGPRHRQDRRPGEALARPEGHAPAGPARLDGGAAPPSRARRLE